MADKRDAQGRVKTDPRAVTKDNRLVSQVQRDKLRALELLQAAMAKLTAKGE
jgi:hypothetical protein